MVNAPAALVRQMFVMDKIARSVGIRPAPRTHHSLRIRFFRKGPSAAKSVKNRAAAREQLHFTEKPALLALYYFPFGRIKQ
ncbi:MAG: hypothetical protein A3B03_02615 [Candidatus Zambryskibacteria bacterium RIFCSPLOWO2_01_FULL_42_41]|nr:MAG: hypothetical protein A3B03_02615 [Candidatus Zambryskibacteria bacterium RIFCSPLOWO2_01_FULL_42_41]